MQTYFVDKDSIVRKIWGSSDTVLFIFAGAAAEFALSKAVDWLYFTGKLPNDPLGRLFSTVTYARDIIFSEQKIAITAIDRINNIHKGVEGQRGYEIPKWAYLDVLYLLIDYSIRSFELLERKLTNEEKNEVFTVFCKVGKQMKLTELPENYSAWTEEREKNIENNLQKSNYTVDLYTSYKKHLGRARFQILKQVQVLLVPEKVGEMLFKNRVNWIEPLLVFYKILRFLKLSARIKLALLPVKYKEQVLQIDQ